MCSPAKPSRWIGGLALLLLAATAFAQKPKIESFDVDDGLPSSAIFDLAQDPSGRLWIISRGGLTVYDGRSFSPPATSDVLPKLGLRFLEIDSSGRIWIAARTPHGLFYLEDGSWHRWPAPDDGSSDPILLTAMAVAGSGDEATIVLGTMAHGLQVGAGEAWSRWSATDGLPSDRIHSVAVHADRVAVGTSAGLCFIGEPGLARPHLEGPDLDCRPRTAVPRLAGPILGLRSIVNDDQKQLWILGQDWLGYLKVGATADALQIAAQGFELSSINPTLPGAITIDAIGGIYFGTSASGFYLDPEMDRLLPMGSRQGLLSEGANALLTDRESGIWIGGLRGLSRVAGWRFESYDRNDGLLESEVSTVAETGDGTLVFGHNTGLTFFDGQRFETVRFERSTPIGFSHRALDVATDDDGAVWVAAQQVGLLRVVSPRAWNVALAERVLSVEVDAMGTLWTLTRDTLFQRQNSKFQPVETGRQGEFESLRWLHASDDGRLFLGGRGGVRWRSAHEPDRWHLARGPTLGSNNVFNIYAESMDTVWVGTGDGLFRLVGEQLAKVRHAELTIDRPVFMILRGPAGRMWFGTDGGVFVWDGQKNRQLTARHGLIGRETNRGGGWVDRRGQVWIGTDQGVSMYRQRHDTVADQAPVVRVREVEVDGHLWPAESRGAVPSELELTHRQRNLTFRFDAISLARGQTVLYQHRLEGFDDAWQGPAPLAAAEVRYTNLPPGEYRLAVVAGWAEGPWSEPAISRTTVIAPPFWRRPWFFGLVVAALGLGIPGVYRLRTQAIRARNAELESLNRKLGTHIEERESLIAELEAKNEELERFTYTVSHDLKSPLVTIKGFLGYLRRHVEDGDPERMSSDLDRIENAAETMGRLLGDLLELSRVGRVVQEPEVFDLEELVREAVELVAKPIEDRGVSFAIAPDLPEVFADRGRFLEVFQNLIENAIKFLGDSPSPRIEIGVRPRATGAGGRLTQSQGPVITVRDNGVGIEPRFHDQIFGLFNRLDPTIDGTGVGLTLARRIVEFHGGRIWVESEGLGHGTTFCLTVPKVPADSEQTASAGV